MTTLVIQVVIKQWDKSEQSESHQQARQLIPDRYPVVSASAQSLMDERLWLDRHGDDVMGNRIQCNIVDNNRIVVDRLGFDLTDYSVVYFPPKETESAPSQIAILEHGWIQCRYKWRYRVFESGLYYWLYEEMTFNVCSVETLDENVFMTTQPVLVYQG